MDAQDTLTHCPKCEDEFGLNQHIPHILPCLHSMCNTCIQEMLPKKTRKNKSIKCATCSVKHEVGTSGVDSFPKNQYVTAFLKKKPVKRPAEDIDSQREYRRCLQHRLEMTLFCTEEECNKTICSRCFLGDHKQHHVMDVDEEQEKYEKVKTNVERLILAGKGHLLKGKADLAGHFFQQEDLHLANLRAGVLKKVASLFDEKQAELLKCNVACSAKLQGLLDQFDEANEILTSEPESGRRMNARQMEKLQQTLCNALDKEADVDVPVFNLTDTYSDFEETIQRTITRYLSDSTDTKSICLKGTLNPDDIIKGKSPSKKYILYTCFFEDVGGRSHGASDPFRFQMAPIKENRGEI